VIWQAKHWLWRFEARFDPAELLVLTPLFVFSISDGGEDILYDRRWYGIRLWWKRNRNRQRGEILFLKEYEAIMREENETSLY
jgi:hypothetical protein